MQKNVMQHTHTMHERKAVGRTALKMQNHTIHKKNHHAVDICQKNRAVSAIASLLRIGALKIFSGKHLRGRYGTMRMSIPMAEREQFRHYLVGLAGTLATRMQQAVDRMQQAVDGHHENKRRHGGSALSAPVPVSIPPVQVPLLPLDGLSKELPANNGCVAVVSTEPSETRETEISSCNKTIVLPVQTQKTHRTTSSSVGAILCRVAAYTIESGGGDQPMELGVSLYYYARKICVRFAVDASRQPGLASALALRNKPAVNKHAAFICDCVQRGFKTEKKAVSRKVPAFDETTTVVEFEEFLQVQYIAYTIHTLY
jgi:hypothetical protein